MKKKLFLDFDGVIASTIEAIVSLYNEDFQYYKKFEPINWRDINTWDFTECKCTDAEFINKYFNQPRFFGRLKFMKNAKTIIYTLDELYDVYIVTMGFRPNLVGKRIWLQSHLSYIPEDKLIGVNMKKYRDKSHIDMSGGILVDDSYSNLVTSNADRRICFGEVFEWNKEWKGERSYDWSDLSQRLIR